MYFQTHFDSSSYDNSQKHYHNFLELGTLIITHHDTLNDVIGPIEKILETLKKKFHLKIHIFQKF